MSITLKEHVTSRSMRQVRRDTNLELELKAVFIVFGSDDPSDSAVLAAGPQYADPWDGVLPLYAVEHEWEVLRATGSTGIMKLVVTFGHPSRLVVSENEIELNTMTDTAHVEKALEQVHYPDPDPNDVGDNIGVTEDKVEGVDIFVPKATYSETMELEDIDDTYRDLLIEMVGTINDDTFKGWAADEVIFLGAQVTKRGNGNFKLKFQFGVSFTVTDDYVTESGTETVTKPGWDYLWQEKSRDSDGSTVNHTVVAVHVAQVYPQADFSALGV